MPDYTEYTIDDDGYQGNGNGNGNGNGYHGNGHNGYDQLDGDYATYYKVANGFTGKVKSEDREDFLHDLILVMARVKAKYDAKGKELTEGGLMRVAQYELSDYWHKRFKRINGINCKECSKAQREKCKDWYLYPDCPKAVKTERLDKVVEDGNGDSTPLHELIADDNAVDVSDRLDARLTLQSYPHKFVKIAYKKYAGYPLTPTERAYLYRQRSKAYKISQKSLVFA